MSVQKEHPGVSTLIGSPKEVQLSLGKSLADQNITVQENIRTSQADI